MLFLKKVQKKWIELVKCWNEWKLSSVEIKIQSMLFVEVVGKTLRVGESIYLKFKNYCGNFLKN